MATDCQLDTTAGHYYDSRHVFTTIQTCSSMTDTLQHEGKGPYINYVGNALIYIRILPLPFKF